MYHFFKKKKLLCYWRSAKGVFRLDLRQVLQGNETLLDKILDETPKFVPRQFGHLGWPDPDTIPRRLIPVQI